MCAHYKYFLDKQASLIHIKHWWKKKTLKIGTEPTELLNHHLYKVDKRQYSVE